MPLRSRSAHSASRRQTRHLRHLPPARDRPAAAVQDRSFTFVLKTPPASKLILKAADLKKGSGTPQKVIATISEAQLREIAEIKLPDLNATTVEAAMNVVHGTCRSLGVAVEGREHRK